MTLYLGGGYTEVEISEKGASDASPTYDHELAEMTVRVAKAASPDGNAVMKIRAELGRLFAEDEFAVLYPAIGQPVENPACLALERVMNYEP